MTRKLFTTSWKMHTATPKKNSRLLSVLSRCCPKFQTTTFPSPPNNFPVRVYMFILHIYIKSNNKKTNFGVGLTVCVCMCVQLFLFSPKKGYFFSLARDARVQSVPEFSRLLIANFYLNGEKTIQKLNVFHISGGPVNIETISLKHGTIRFSSPLFFLHIVMVLLKAFSPRPVLMVFYKYYIHYI